VRTAERLFAENGIDDGVSLRQIAAEAGYRSPAAVQYHFGSKAILLQAIVDYRLPSIAHRRVQLLEQLDRQHQELDVRRLVEVLARPFFELGSDAYFVELSARLIERPELEALFDPTSEHGRVTREIEGRLHRALNAIPATIRENRIRMARYLVLSAIANRRTRQAAGHQPDLPDDLFIRDLIDATAGLLCADHTTVREEQIPARRPRRPNAKNRT
jgi:AcrR family transcriptional regulator